MEFRYAYVLRFLDANFTMLFSTLEGALDHVQAHIGDEERGEFDQLLENVRLKGENLFIYYPGFSIQRRILHS